MQDDYLWQSLVTTSYNPVEHLPGIDVLVYSAPAAIHPKTRVLVCDYDENNTTFTVPVRLSMLLPAQIECKDGQEGVKGADFFSALGTFKNLGRCSNDAGYIGEIGRNDHGVVGFGQFAEFMDISFGNAQVDSVQSAILGDGFGDIPQSGCGRCGHHFDLGRLTLRLVDALLFLALGFGDHGLSFSFCAIDFSLFETF